MDDPLKVKEAQEQHQRKLQHELAAIRKINPENALPEVVTFLNAHAQELHNELKRIQKRKV
jgi:hypothetical protein